MNCGRVLAASGREGRSGLFPETVARQMTVGLLCSTGATDTTATNDLDRIRATGIRSCATHESFVLNKMNGLAVCREFVRRVLRKAAPAAPDASTIYFPRHVICALLTGEWRPGGGRRLERPRGSFAVVSQTLPTGRHLFMSQGCPRCGLLNPPEATRCDCGYDFASKTVQSSYLLAHVIEKHGGEANIMQQASRTQFRTGALVLISAAIVTGLSLFLR
jgi:hypothetical protein